MIAPMYFGIFNIIINLVGNKLKWSMKKRYLIFTFISWLLTTTVATHINSYNFNSTEWRKYYIYLLISSQPL